MLDWVKNLYQTDGKFDLAKAATTAGGIATLYGALKPDSSVGEFLGMGSSQQPVGYTGGIPEYDISRQVLPEAFATTTAEGTPRRPGSMGRRYFTDTTFTPTGEVMSATGTPATDTAATTNATSGLLSALPEEAVLGLLSSFFGGGIGDTSGTTGDDYTEGLATDSSTQAAAQQATQQLSAFEQFLAPYYGRRLTNEDIMALGGSGFDIGDIESAFGLDAGTLANKYTRLRNAADVASTYESVPADGDYSQKDYDQVSGLITSGKTTISDVADQYGATSAQVADILLNEGTMTPDQLLEYYQTRGNPDLTMVELMGWLASTGETTVEELVNLFPQYSIQDIGFTLIDQGYMTPAQIAAQYPELSTEQATEIYRSMGGTRYAGGGLASLGGKGYYLGGSTDGMADQIPATIDGQQPAALSDGEFVIPADVVSHLGNGNSNAGAQELYAMMDKVREDRTGTTAQGTQINPRKYLPA